ncbi:hypothetical protein GWO43_19975 [candidate division KSB1 bacterium]|nr:hypothetical protein [candidate division KSB1 bacterium]NIR71550.1 hypothetical protein [candidate division KSB1 bacterium]NIS26346.1 hypothetical protein [candidate division KSB1 bacterium]NIT73113.1 hypothetical protein [candidate division KSB1 bacterium]NIU27029.1 hypothetical protein [candidate division KSB1 bacterium]
MINMKGLLLVLVLGIVSPTLAQGNDGWMFKSPMPTPRLGFSAVLFNGKIYVMGGQGANGKVLNVVERYDPATDIWETDLPDLRDNRVHGAAVVFDGKIFVMGGRSDGDQDEEEHEDDNSGILKKVEFFDPEEEKWESFQDLVTRREGLSAVVLQDTMYAIGGSDSINKILKSVEYYDGNEDEWKIFDRWRLIFPSAALQTVVVNDSAFSIGGFFTGPVGSIQRYHPKTGISLRANLRTPRGSLAATSRHETIYILGGQGVTQVLKSMEVYVPSSNRLEESVPLNTARQNFAAITVNNTIYAIGGQDADGKVLDSVEAFDIVTSVTVKGPSVPEEFDLQQNYPNPFNAGTRINFSVPRQAKSAPLKLQIYNLRGQVVQTLVNRKVAPGEYEVFWDGTDHRGSPVPSGIHVYTLELGSMKISKKMTLIR